MIRMNLFEKLIIFFVMLISFEGISSCIGGIGSCVELSPSSVICVENCKSCCRVEGCSSDIEVCFNNKLDRSNVADVSDIDGSRIIATIDKYFCSVLDQYLCKSSDSRSIFNYLVRDGYSSRLLRGAVMLALFNRLESNWLENYDAFLHTVICKYGAEAAIIELYVSILSSIINKKMFAMKDILGKWGIFNRAGVCICNGCFEVCLAGIIASKVVRGKSILPMVIEYNGRKRMIGRSRSKEKSGRYDKLLMRIEEL